MTIQETAREFINKDEIKEELDISQRVWLEFHIIDLLEAYKAHVSKKRFFCDMESKKEERCETQCLLCTEIE